ncbi:MAG: NAD(P)H-hydrate epimerase [Chloroflexi bacterium]|nr:NAD(P)H-hydrate epimerase [Chloroflexota bacterium]
MNAARTPSAHPRRPATRARAVPASPSAALPADDAGLMAMDLRELRAAWSASAARAPIGAEAMTGADRRAQSLGVSGERLMEHAGTAVAAATRAIADATGRLGRGPVLVLCGPGNNGGDGFVAARRLAQAGIDVVVALVSSAARPSTLDAARNWDRLAAEPRVTRVQTPVARDIAILGTGIDKASVVVDALLGTGVRGVLREPVRGAVELIGRARTAGIPIVAVDTPTAVDVSSGDPSDPVVQADLTVTFHRPKTGFRSRRGAALAGRVLVAPIGIPPEADRG